jgi:preprotein translocase subunit Sss1
MPATSLKLSSRKPDEKLSPDQERFRYLLAQIERTRKARAEVEKAIQEFRRRESEVMQPLRTSLRAALRDTVLTIDRVLEQTKWARIDRNALEEILRATAEMLLERDPEDAELKAVFDRHSKTSFDENKREELERLKAEAENMMGVEFDEGEIANEDDLAQRMYEHLAKEKEKEQQQEQHAEKRSRERKSAAQQRVEASAQAAKKFLREMYRKLASAVHPDREPDAQRRAEKNELMQTINRAYAANDLLTLLEAQMQLEQIDPDHIAKLSRDRLTQYNKLLAEQLTNARKGIEELQTGFCMDYSLESTPEFAPHKLGHIIKRQARGIRQEIERQKQFLEVLRTPAATKRWLKTQRRFAQGYLDEDEEF